MTREEAIKILLLEKEDAENCGWKKILEALDMAHKSLDFAQFVANEIFSEDFEVESFKELTCRRLHKIGIVEKKDGYWELRK